jgi:iron complex transport system permease protein
VSRGAPTRVAGGGRLSLPVVLGLGGAALVGALLASIAIGATVIPLDRALAVLAAPDGSREAIIVADARLPRTLIGATVGAALGVAGAVMQAVSRNPLAEPGILGVSWGAALGAVGAQVALGIGSPAAAVGFALLGAAGAGATVVLIGSLGRGGLSPARLVVAGAAVSTLLWSVLQGLLVIDHASLEASRRWLAGSLSGRDEASLLQVAPYLGAGLVLALLLARPLTALSLGDDVARGLGQRTGTVKVAAALAVVLLAGAAVAVAGPIVLVGLAVPHVARALVGRDYSRVLPVSGLLGAVLVLAADVAGRRVMPPEEVPVGVMAALLGAPVFLHAVRRGVRPL